MEISHKTTRTAFNISKAITGALLKIVLTVIAIIIVIVLLSRGKTLINDNEVKNEAINYLISKYNFNKKDLKITYYERYQDGFMSFTPASLKVSTSSGKEIYVYFDGVLENHDIRDNYQNVEIEEAVSKVFTDKFSAVKRVLVDNIQNLCLSTSRKYNNDINEYLLSSVTPAGLASGFNIYIPVGTNNVETIYNNYIDEISKIGLKYQASLKIYYYDEKIELITPTYDDVSERVFDNVNSNTYYKVYTDEYTIDKFDYLKKIETRTTLSSGYVETLPIN